MSKKSLSIAMKKLSYRSYSQNKLKEILSKYNFDDNDIYDTIETLISYGYLDDNKLAQDIF